jgi:hypothetical protein
MLPARLRRRFSRGLTRKHSEERRGARERANCAATAIVLAALR